MVLSSSCDAIVHHTTDVYGNDESEWEPELLLWYFVYLNLPVIMIFNWFILAFLFLHPLPYYHCLCLWLLNIIIGIIRWSLYGEMAGKIVRTIMKSDSITDRYRSNIAQVLFVHVMVWQLIKMAFSALLPHSRAAPLSTLSSLPWIGMFSRKCMWWTRAPKYWNVSFESRVFYHQICPHCDDEMQQKADYVLAPNGGALIVLQICWEPQLFFKQLIHSINVAWQRGTLGGASWVAREHIHPKDSVFRRGRVQTASSASVSAVENIH